MKSTAGTETLTRESVDDACVAWLPDVLAQETEAAIATTIDAQSVLIMDLFIVVMCEKFDYFEFLTANLYRLFY